VLRDDSGFRREEPAPVPRQAPAGDKPDAGRDGLARDRTMLANERTLAAGWRTSASAMAVALAFAHLFGDVDPGWLVRAGATMLAVVALILLPLTARAYTRTSRRIETDDVYRLSSLELWGITALLGCAGLIVCATIGLA
jgi:putative membrane protein